MLQKSITQYWLRCASSWEKEKFCDKHEDLLKLVFPVADLNVVLGCQRAKNWAFSTQHVRTLVGCGDLGRMLFADRLAGLNGAEFSTKLMETVDAWQHLSLAMRAMAANGLQQDLVEMAERACEDKNFVALKTAKIPFCGVVMDIPTADAVTEANYRYQAAMRDCSIGHSNGLPPLPHERWLFPERSTTQGIAALMLPEAHTAREHFRDLAVRGNNLMLCQLAGMVDEPKKMKTFLDQDPWFVLEALYLRYKAEDELNAYVRRCLLSTMASEHNDVTVQQALAYVKHFQTTALLQDAELVESIQLVDAVSEQIEALLGSVGPSLGESPSRIKQQFFERYGWFFSWEVIIVEGDGSETETRVRGPSSFRSCLIYCRSVYETRPAEFKLGMIRPLSGFGFLMSKTVQQEYRTWVLACSKNIEAGDEELHKPRLERKVESICEEIDPGPVQGGLVKAEAMQPDPMATPTKREQTDGDDLVDEVNPRSTPTKNSTPPSKRMRSKAPWTGPSPWSEAALVGVSLMEAPKA